LRKIYNDEFKSIPYSGDQIKKKEMSGTCVTYVGRRDVYRVLVGKSGGKSTHGIPRTRWEDNIKMYLQE
jgi:hypothetical protein